MIENKTISLGPDDGALVDAGIGTMPAPEMDPADYLPDMDGFDMEEAQKIALLETLWSIMRAFVEIGVDVGEADPCGQVFGDFSGNAPEGVTSSFSKAASAPTGHNHNKKEDVPT